MSDLRIGISGWTCGGRRGVFYPPEWPQKRELEFAAQQLNSIEIYGTFYSPQQPGDAALITTSPPSRRAQRDGYVYFDNDRKVRAPFDAMRLAERLTPKRQRKSA